jgi:hypothetical protein
MLDPQARLPAARTSSDYKKSSLPLHGALRPDECGCEGIDDYAADTAAMIDRLDAVDLLLLVLHTFVIDRHRVVGDDFRRGCLVSLHRLSFRRLSHAFS